MRPYDAITPDAGRALPHTEDIAARVLVLPGGAGIGQGDVALICDLLIGVLGQAEALDGFFAERSENGSTA